MGGWGSGRWQRSKYGIVEQTYRVDVLGAYRGGPPAEGKANLAVFSWDARKAVVQCYRDRAVIDWWAGQAAVNTEIVPCRFGGERVYFRCPRCDSRRLHLYLCARGKALCRGCEELTYASQRETVEDRYRRKARALRRRVDRNASGSLNEPFPRRAKWMRWVTYERLRMREAEANRTSLGYAIAALERIKSRLPARPVDIARAARYAAP